MERILLSQLICNFKVWAKLYNISYNKENKQQQQQKKIIEFCLWNFGQYLYFQILKSKHSNIEKKKKKIFFFPCKKFVLIYHTLLQRL